MHPAKDPAAAGKQTNLAEGEPDIIDESIRIHEKKGDAQGKKAENKPSGKPAKNG